MLSARDLPNVLTVLRIFLVAPLVYLLLTRRYPAALILAVIAGLSDWLDGALARHFNWQSRFGGMLDPLADKLLMVAAYATLTWLGELPVWLFMLALVRDLAIVIGGLVYHYRFEPLQPEPTRLSKFNTVCQIALMWAVLIRLAGIGLPQTVVQLLIWLVALSIVATLFQYVLLWGRRAWRIAAQRGRET